MILAQIPASELRTRLARGHLALQVGPFRFRVTSPLASVSEGLATLYPDFELVAEDEFIDFHVSVTPPAGVRRWIRPQANFSFDGRVPFKPLPADQAMPMLEWGLNWVISNHAHQYLMLHAAVVERNGRAMILPAPPGSGKSTLCAGLVNRDWRLLSDELTLIRLTDGLVVPISRPVSLKNRSIEIVRGLGRHVVVGTPCADTGKGTVAHMRPPTDSVRRMAEPARPAWVVFPQFIQNGEPTCEARGKSTAFVELVHNAFNYNLLGLAGFNALSGLVDACDVHRITYGSLEQAYTAIDALTGE
ncbi:MAG: HprK-related kinase A [Pseudomonadota bacterium]|nr:HprK-related kinase A [Pseudomonadota bacterium]